MSNSKNGNFLWLLEYPDVRRSFANFMKTMMDRRNLEYYRRNQRRNRKLVSK